MRHPFPQVFATLLCSASLLPGAVSWDFQAEELGSHPHMTNTTASINFTRPLRRSSARPSSLVAMHQRLSKRHYYRINKTIRLGLQTHGCKDPDMPGVQSSPWTSNLLLSDCLGQGGFGQVWSVCIKSCSIDLGQDRCMAMKLVRRNAKYTEHRFSQALERERACLTQFSGGPFIDMYGYSGGEGDIAYFLMEQARGGDASKTGALFSIVDGRLMRGGSTLHRKDVAFLLHDLVEGLQRLHSKGVVHRDVKSSNLFLTNPCGPGTQCRGKLSDFGLACGMESIDNTMLSAALTKCDDIVGGGTRSWWSPEHGTDRSPTEKLDIWGAGLVLYQLIFGEWPGIYVRDKGKAALARSIQKFRIADDQNFKQLNRRAQSLGTTLGSYYTLLGSVLSSMLEFDPNARPDSEGLLESARHLCEVCGVNPHRRHHEGDQGMVACVEESSRGTSIGGSSASWPSE